MRRPATPEVQEAVSEEADEVLGDAVQEGMGLGDVKMLAMVGAFLGPQLVIMTILLASIVGTLCVLPLLLAGRRGMKSAIPFGPFLGIGALVAMLWGEPILRWYSDLVIPLPFLP
jgi:leader peptidase (prepilin peptidase)/N-methyltransferase